MEVLIATGIFAMAGVGLAAALERSISAGIGVQRQTRIGWRMESMFSEARVAKLQPGKEIVRADESGIAYEKEITKPGLKTDRQQGLAGIYDVKITARWMEDGRAMSVNAEEYVYQP